MFSTGKKSHFLKNLKTVTTKIIIYIFTIKKMYLIIIFKIECKFLWKIRHIWNNNNKSSYLKQFSFSFGVWFRERHCLISEFIQVNFQMFNRSYVRLFMKWCIINASLSLLLCNLIIDDFALTAGIYHSQMKNNCNPITEDHHWYFSYM